MEQRNNLTAHYPHCWATVADFLSAVGVRMVFGLPGDDVGIVEVLHPARLRLVVSRDQRNAVYMATGYAMQSGSPGVCVLGKGPAVTNALTGLLEARSSSVPLLVLAGGTAQEMRGTRSFQELDQVSTVGSLVKWAHRVESAERLVPALEEAWAVTTAGRPGPVYLEVPDHLLDATVTRRRPWSPPVETPVELGPAAVRGPALDAIRAAQRPVLVIGGGMRHRNAHQVLERLADRLGAAVFVTASGRGTVGEDHPSFCGLTGLYAPKGTESVLGSSDLVISIGSRLEETATVRWDDLDLAGKIVQVNIDQAEFSAHWTGHRVASDGGAVVRAWLAELTDHRPDPAWAAFVAEARRGLHERAAAALRTAAEGEKLQVREVLAAIEEALPPDRVLVQENGLQDMWSYCYPAYSVGGAGGSVVPSEQTPLGFGAAAAAGVKLADPGRVVVAWVGDGAFHGVAADLPALDREGIGVIYVVLRNGGLGWLQHQLDRRRADGRVAFVHADADLPVRDALRVRDRDDLVPRLKEAVALADGGRPVVLDVPVQLSDVPPNVLSHIEAGTAS